MLSKYLKLSNVSMTYFGDYVGLDNINFEVDCQQSVGFWGGKFDGKTNLLKVIAGLEHLSSGTVDFCGQDINKIKAKERNFAFSFDEKSLFQKKSVGYNISYPLILRKLDTNFVNERTQYIANCFGLADNINCNILKLDKKQKCLVLIARAFVRECNLYLIDNVFEKLEEDERKESFMLFDDFVKKNNLMTIYCSSNFDEVVYFGKKVGILNNCKLVDFGTKEELQKNMKHLQTQKCLFGGEVEVGKLFKEAGKYFINCNEEIIETNAPVDDVYLQKEVVFVVNKEFIEYYYDLASEYRVSLIKKNI